MRNVGIDKSHIQYIDTSLEEQHLEYFDGAFDSTVAEKMKPENWPYVGSSKTEGVVYTVITDSFYM